MDKDIFFHDEKIYNIRSAEIILPLVFSSLSVKSVLDVGCGIGTWLSVAKKLGAELVVGVDGDYVDRNLLRKYIFESEFRSFDLTQPFNFNRKFDLVICLEVVEHLSELAAQNIVDSLVEHSDVILFSAAIPGQGGQNHINEQWPEYWSVKFKKRGFVFVDSIRPVIWNDPRIDFWYKQNSFLVVKENHPISQLGIFKNNFGIHPQLFELKIEENELLIRTNKALKSEIWSINSGNISFKRILKILIKKIFISFHIPFIRWK